MGKTITVTFGGSSDTGAVITEVPRELGNVRLIEEVGQGGMGVVWRGHDEFLDRDVAVKLMRCTLIGDDQEATRMFIKGARAAAVVKHPNVVSIFHADQIADIVYIVMEFAAGENLGEVLYQRGSFEPRLAALVVAKILDALSQIHEAQVIHRDVKPANVIFDVDGELQVTDFGLSYVQQTTERDPLKARGTPPYMAPEMFDGEASFQSDIYAVGIMYYELLCGQRPFKAESIEEYGQQHRGVPLPEQPLEPLGLPEEVLEMLLRATHKRKMFRYKSAGHMLKALGDVYPRILQDETLDRRLRDFVLGRGVKAAGERTAQRQPQDTDGTYFDLMTKKAEAKRHRKDPSSEG